MTDGSIPKHPVNRPNTGNSDFPGVTQITQRDIHEEGIRKGNSDTCSTDSLCVTLPAAVKLAISRTAGRVPWQRGLFDFARSVYFEVGGEQADFSNKGPVWRVVRAWHKAAKPEGVGLTDAWAEFIVCWPKIKSPAGADRLALAVDEVERDLGGPLRHAFPHDRAMERLLLLCWVLSQTSDNGEFYLGVHSAMTVCGFNNKMTAWRRLQVLEAEGWIRRLRPGNIKRRHATVYKFIGRY